MKVVLLAGGFGTRLAEYTETIPKPMVTIGGKPILWHIMRHYSRFGFKEFYLALGYKSDFVKDYFLKYRSLSTDFTVNLNTGCVTTHQSDVEDWSVTLIDTGINSMTGGRVRRLKKFICGDTFLLTYGDGLSNINVDDLIKFHRSHGKMVTVTAVRPSARFGELNIRDGSVTSFREKPQMDQGWINGGFFVVEPSFLDLIDGDETVLEHEPLERVAKMGQLMAYQYDGFWQCMDTKRDRDLLENLWLMGRAPWIS